MSQTASQRPKRVLVVLFVLALVAVAGFVGWRLMGDDDHADPLKTGPNVEAPPTTSTSSAATTEAPTTKPTASPRCEGPNTLFNVEGRDQKSLLPDCGATYACRSDHPVIMFKTTLASGDKTLVCGEDSSGESIRVLIKPRGGAVLDLRGSYEYQIDSFVAKNDGTTYVVHAYDGTLVVKKNGSSAAQKSSDWISLDNESDYD